ncbi:uncharacterized protein [Argopecten irradians]|uniref:uncharacterized protein n=1 Tax=Argopecten irradians TaxID=31199 RepID=UPI003723E251
MTTNTQWRYCPTECNPADLPPRGMSMRNFESNHLWFKGPDWLTNEKEWPQWIDQIEPALQTTEDQNTSNCLSVIQNKDNPGIHNVMDISRFGSYKKMLRVTAYVQRFILVCESTSPWLGPLKVEELKNASEIWIRNAQERNFQDEIVQMKTGKTKSNSIVRQLKLYMDEQDLIRCGGRIQNAAVCEATKFPILLPTKDEVTSLIVMDAHVNQCHSGIGSTVTLLRQTF